MLEIFLTSFATLFVIIDPIGIAAISVGLTKDKSQSETRRIIVLASIVAFAILFLFGLAGEGFLERIGISMPAFRISGGILLFLTALEMLFGARVERRASVSGGNDPSIYPLAMPLLAGPGAMTAMILLMGEHQGDWLHEAVVLSTLALILILCIVLSLLFNRFSRHLGETGIEIINRFLAIVLAALAIQFIADGAFEFISGMEL